MSTAALTQYTLSPIRHPERRADYRSMRFMMVVSSFLAGTLAGTAMQNIIL
jgi:hypothetical protein